MAPNIGLDGFATAHRGGWCQRLLNCTDVRHVQQLTADGGTQFSGVQNRDGAHRVTLVRVGWSRQPWPAFQISPTPCPIVARVVPTTPGYLATFEFFRRNLSRHKGSSGHKRVDQTGSISHSGAAAPAGSGHWFARSSTRTTCAECFRIIKRPCETEPMWEPNGPCAWCGRSI